MADFVDSEAEEPESEEEINDVGPTRRLRHRVHKKILAIDSDEEEEDGDEREVSYLVDDNPIQEESDNEPDRFCKRKKSDDEEDDLDYRLDDEDYELMEDNLGVKFKKKRRRIIQEAESDDEAGQDVGDDREVTASQLFDDSDNEDEHPSDRGGGSDDSEGDDFIVDENDRPLRRRRIRQERVYADETLQEAQDIFGADFDYDDFNNEEDSRRYEDLSESDEDEPDQRQPIKSDVINIADVFESVELEKIGVTDEAKKVQMTDLPERFQIRSHPLNPTGSEINKEAIWIYTQVFAAKHGDAECEGNELNGATNVIMDQIDEDWTEDDGNSCITTTTTTASPITARNRILTKIKKIIKLIRDEKFEVPFIFYHNKDLIRPEFTLYDLWRIYEMDEEFDRLCLRRTRILRLFLNMKVYQKTLTQQEMISKFIRPITDDEIDVIEHANSLEELQDLRTQFLLYYSDDVPKMKALMFQQRMEKEGLIEDVENITYSSRALSSGGGRGMYRICKQNGVGNFLPLLGLTAEDFGVNFEANEIINTTHQCELTLEEAIEAFKTERWSDTKILADAAKYMLATQISRDFNVRKAVRAAFFKKSKISVTLTLRGSEVVDENHPVFPMRFLSGKPIEEMDGLDYFELVQAEKEKLIVLSVAEDIEDRKGLDISLIEEAKGLFRTDEEDPNAKKWQEFRDEIIEYTFKKFLYPEFSKEVRTKLLEKGKKIIRQRCSDKIYNYLRHGPFHVNFEEDKDDQEWDTSNGFRVMGMAFYDDSIVHGAILDKDGDVINQIVVSELFIKHMKTMHDGLVASKEAHMLKLRNIIELTKPHVIVIGGESRGALTLMEDMKSVLLSFPASELNFQSIPVLIIENEISKVYSRTTLAMNEFPETSEVFRQAVSLGRFLQDPLLELARLVNRDEDILSLPLYKHQGQISKEELLRAIEIEFINRTSETGVDINEAIQLRHRSGTLQFVPGFGYQKATSLLNFFRSKMGKVESRAEMVTKYDMGSIVFNNCAGFLKINRRYLCDEAESDPRDQTRIHPKYYAHALAVARAVVEDDVERECDDLDLIGIAMTNQESQSSLLDLDLTEYLDQLRRNGFGDFNHLFEDIKIELMNPFADLRKPFQPPDSETLFYILTKETPDSIREGKLITAQVTGIKYRAPTDDEFEEAMPAKDQNTGMFMCKFCSRIDFQSLDDIWQHYDDKLGSCPGKIQALRIHHGNGLSGHVRLESFSDTPPDPRELRSFADLRPPIVVRILRLSQEYFFIDCTSKTTDLQNPAFMPKKDEYYDEHGEAEFKRNLMQKIQKLQLKNSFIRRNINHPSFKNISYEEAIPKLKDSESGDLLFTPSLQGLNFLSLMWTVVPGIQQHLIIQEANKPNLHSLGTILTIGRHKYEDLDEIIVRHVNTQVSYIREIVEFKYYTPENYEEPELATEILEKEKEKNPAKTHYIICASRKKPGTFILSSLPLDSVSQEFITVGPDGLYFRSLLHKSIMDVVHHWKTTFQKQNENVQVQMKNEQNGEGKTLESPPKPDNPQVIKIEVSQENTNEIII